VENNKPKIERKKYKLYRTEIILWTKEDPFDEYNALKEYDKKDVLCTKQESILVKDLWLEYPDLYEEFLGSFFEEEMLKEEKERLKEIKKEKIEKEKKKNNPDS